MKASELIHGGLYLIHDTSDVVVRYDITSNSFRSDWYEYPLGLFRDDVCATDGDRYIFVKPIPFTEEILEKNGFDIVQDGDSLTIWKQKDDEYGNEVYDITIYASKGVMRLDTSIRYHGAIRKNICYVHELQRALRCCGLWDLADNFVV